MMRPLWVDVEDSRYPPLRSDLNVDIAIVGAGLSGMGAAWALRDSGLRVAVIEERTVGSGASGRNGGFVLAGPAMSYCDAVANCGTDVAEELWRLTLDNNRSMADFVTRYRIECGFLRRGSMSLAVSNEEMGLLFRCHDDLEAAGISTAITDRDGLPIPFDEIYVGGIYYPGNGEMNSGMFARGIARVAAESVSIFEGTAVREIAADGSWRLQTDGGAVRADAVILATNAYTSTLLPGIPIAPTRGQVLATTSLGRVIVPFPMYANFGYQYWRQTADGRLVVGGWRDTDVGAEVGTEERLHDDIQGHLLAFARTVAGEDITIEYRWAGIMGFTPDQFPLVGSVPGHDGLFMAAGYSGHGVSMAFTCGGLAAACARGVAPRIPTVFSPGRFARTPSDHA